MGNRSVKMDLSIESNGSNHPERTDNDLEDLTSTDNNPPLRDIENNLVEQRQNRGGKMELIGELGLGQPMMPQMQNEEIPLHSRTRSQSNEDQNSLETMGDSVASSLTIPIEMSRATDLLMEVTLNVEENRTKIRELASSAMEELVKKATRGEPLWQRQAENASETLNEAEYIREFRAYDATLQEIMRMIQVEGSGSFGSLDENFHFSNENQLRLAIPQAAEPNHLQTEASREIGFANMNGNAIVEKFMDSREWSSVFSKIVSKAVVLGVISSGRDGSLNESLQVMRSEFHMPTPLIPVRESQFARYCKQLDPHTWGIVDVSMETIFPYPVLAFRRRPSGCLIQEMPNGIAKIIWVEHAEVDTSRIHMTFRPLIQSGIIFGAKRWVETLTYHCEWLSTLMFEHSPAIPHGLLSLNGKASLLRLGEIMMRKFCGDLSASSDNLWLLFPDNALIQDYRIMCKRFHSTESVPMTSIAFSTSICLAASPGRVFDFLRGPEFRSQWDLLCHLLVVEEVMHIMIGDNHANRISVFQAKWEQETIETMYLQESYRDSAAWYVVYAPMDVQSMAAVFNGDDPNLMNILPSGFVIHSHQNGSILTLSFHIVDPLSEEGVIAGRSFATAIRVLSDTAQLIRDALLQNQL